MYVCVHVPMFASIVWAYNFSTLWQVVNVLVVVVVVVSRIFHGTKIDCVAVFNGAAAHQQPQPQPQVSAARSNNTRTTVSKCLLL